MTTYASKFIKWFYVLFAVVAICMAVLVQAGRSFSHLLADYPEELGVYLSKKLQAKVSIGSINAEWTGLKPMVDVKNLRIVSHTDKPILAIADARLRLDLMDSILHARLVWSALQLQRVKMEFVQSDDGAWQISGIPRAPESPDHKPADMDALIDMALLSRRIELLHSELNFQFASGDVTTMTSPVLRTESTGDFHRLSLQIDVDGKPNTLTVLAEGYGDPRRRETFNSKAFVQLKQFPTSEPIAATTAFLLRGIKAEVISEGSLDASLWFTSRKQHEGYDVVGKLGVQRLNLPMLDRSLALDSFSTAIVGHWLYGGKWQLALQGLDAKVNQQKILPINFAASAASNTDPVVLHLQQVDLARLSKTLDTAGVLGEGRLREFIHILQPHGELRNLQVSIPPKEPKAWKLQANLAQVGANAWQGVPALRKVDGFVEATRQGGFVNIDSRKGFSMHYYPTYSAPMEYQQAKGQVAWWLQPENNQIYVNSGALEFISGDEYAKGYMWLGLPWKRNTGDVDLYLQIGAKKLNASAYSKYTPAVIPRSLLDWLGKSIGTENPGFVNEVGFVYRGTLNNRNRAARSHQLYMDIAHATLNYHPEWPVLEQIDGRLLVSDDDVHASVDKARLFNSEVRPTYVNASPNPDGHGSLLRVQGTVDGGAEDGLRVLRESMLHRYTGSSMDSWKLDGDMHTQLDIAVPLDRLGTGARQQVDIDLHAPHFEMANLKLALNNVSGKISFNEQRGLTSDALQGTLFDQPVKAQLITRKQGEMSQTHIEVKGEVDAKDLASWTQRPEVLFLNGKIPYNVLVELNQKGAQVSDSKSNNPSVVIMANSSLAGVAIDLPSPYNKTANEERPLAFTMSLFDNASIIHLDYNNQIQSLFQLDPRQNNKLLNANISLGSDAKLLSDPQFLLSGKLSNFDFSPWKKIQQRYSEYTSQIDSSKIEPPPQVNAERDPYAVAGLPFRADILLEHYQVGPLALDDVKVHAEHVSDAWKIAFSNTLTTGEIYLPNENSSPMKINLASLRLNSTLLNAQPRDDAAPVQIPKVGTLTVDPRNLPLADLAVKELYLDDINYGIWSLEIRPNDQGVSFDKINGTIKGVSVTGVDQNSGGAQMEWLVNDSVSSTHFVGVLAAQDISVVLREWQKPDMLESKNARFNVDLRWAGDPQDFSLKKIAGNVDVWLEKGRFKNNPSPGSDGFLRLMAVLNFDSLARRLRLDFSDLYKSGLAYDEINGKLGFVPGIMTFTEPLSVKTPSSRLQLAGKLDLEHEKIDSRLVATLPVIGNYTFITALVTGLPAAAGIYFASKLFKKQVDRATSISYTIKGSWSEPKMSFDRLFESEEELINNANKDQNPPAEKKRKRKQK
ncbi:MAG: TIGR02099 family protein [Gammaproteobacteria bacterium]|nr:MAG: TIGR02099 family protein [Gammaproteobacteria bacterium]